MINQVKAYRVQCDADWELPHKLKWKCFNPTMRQTPTEALKMALYQGFVKIDKRIICPEHFRVMNKNKEINSD